VATRPHASPRVPARSRHPKSVDHVECFGRKAAAVASIKDRLPNDVIFYAEYLKNPHHNALDYDRIPKNHLILFGAATPDETFLPNWRDFADILDIEAVPIIFRGKIDNPEMLLGLLKRKSILGKADIEGVAVKNYQRSFLIGGMPVPIMSGKYVSEEFKEVHKETWETGKDRWHIFLQSFRTWSARYFVPVRELV
jgi:hypothetical protein